MATIKLRVDRRTVYGRHFHVSVFDGEDEEHLALCGRIVLSGDGWAALRHATLCEGDALILEDRTDDPLQPGGRDE